MIGIKIADGTFYPILQEEDRVAKKLIVTTSSENQSSIQVALYRGESKEIVESNYIGSLVIENLKPSPEGEPDIELTIGFDSEGNLTASASDAASGQEQSVSIEYAAAEHDMIGDFDAPPPMENEPPPFTDGESLEGFGDDEVKSEKPKPHPLVFASFMFFGFVVLVLLVVLLFRIFQGPSVPPLEASLSLLAFIPPCTTRRGKSRLNRYRKRAG